MILSGDERVIVSAGPVTDHRALRLVDTATTEQRRIELREYELGDTGSLTVIPGDRERFVVKAQLPAGFAVTVRRFDSPEMALAEAHVDDRDVSMRGDGAAWRDLPEVFAGRSPDGGGEHLLCVDAGAGELVPLDWFRFPAYDTVYQGVLTPIQCPEQPDIVIVPVQRSSRLVLWDRRTREVLRHVPLDHNASGAPQLRFFGGELWTDNYDVLLRLSLQDWSIKDSLFLQAAPEGLGGAHIGDWSFTSDGALCVVARPFSGDVLAVDTESFRVTHHCELGRQPLGIAALSDGRIIATDRMTGDLLVGHLSPCSWSEPPRPDPWLPVPR